MAVISIKVDTEYLEMEKAVMRISYTNNLFEDGAAPGIASYPFDLPATPHNLRILGQHNRLDNPENLLGSVAVQVFLYDELYFNAVLNFQKIGSNISVSVTPTLVASFAEFSKTKIADLDYGKFNKYYIPETYRYSIGEFVFEITDSIQIDIDTNTYIQAPLATPLQTVLALIEQVNADTATNGCTCKYLKQLNNFGSPFYEFAVLFKGNVQFDFHPQSITAPTGTPGTGTYQIIVDHLNDPFVTPIVSNQARHMDLVNNDPQDLYKLAFGEHPYRFPIIYNENFFGPPEPTAIYDYFINTFNPATQKYLTRVSTGQQLNTSRSDTPAAEQIFLKYLTEQVFKNNGLTLDTTFFNDAELANLIMLNISSQSKIEREELQYRGPQFISIPKSVCTDTVEEFLVNLKKTFSLHFYYNFKNGDVKMLTAAEVLDASDYIDLTPYLLAGQSVEPFETYANGFAINYNFDSADEYPGEEIKPIPDFTKRFVVGNIGLLPTAGNWQDDVTLVMNQNKYYLVNTLTTPNTWTFLTENFQTEIIEKGTFKIESELEPVLMMDNAGRKTGTTIDEESRAFVPVITPSGMKMPKIKQEGNSVFHNLVNNECKSRLMFWRGFEYTNYPYACYDIYDNTNTARWNYSLKLTSGVGTIAKFHAPFIRNLSQIKKKPTVQVLFNKQQILDFKIWKYYRVESQNMLCKKMDVIFDNEKDCIRPAQLELLKK